MIIDIEVMFLLTKLRFNMIYIYKSFFGYGKTLCTCLTRETTKFVYNTMYPAATEYMHNICMCAVSSSNKRLTQHYPAIHENGKIEKLFFAMFDAHS